VTGRSHVLAALCAGVWLLAAAPAAGATEVDTFVFTPEADTYVESSQPTTSFGKSSSLRVDASPASQTLLRFHPSGLSGRHVVSARLRLYQRDASQLGGRVFAMSSSSWSESTTWSTRPAIDGRQLASFRAVSSGGTYDAELGPDAIVGDGDLSLGVDSTSSDSSVWGSREHSSPPQLVVEVECVPGFVLDGLSQLASPTIGSGDPSYYAGNRRLAVSGGGRLLAVHGRHATGVQLAWRDPGGGWQTRTTGARPDGLLLSGTGTGDWPASIATARDGNGEQHAWVVWAGRNADARRSVQMLRLDELDAAAGPTIGAVTTVDAPALGAYRADVAFERSSDGTTRGTLVWSRRAADTRYEIVTGWFSDLTSPTPTVHDAKVVYASTSSGRYGTLVSAAAGMRLVARASGGALRVYSHGATAPLTSWTAGATGTAVSSSGSPTGVALDSGEVLAATDTDSVNGIVKVQRFSATGAPREPELTLTGYRQPTLASDGTNAWLVLVRASDGYVVSRQLADGAGWSTDDRVEIGAAGGGNHAWPNALREADGRLRFIVRGPAGSSRKSAALAFQRPF